MKQDLAKNSLTYNKKGGVKMKKEILPLGSVVLLNGGT